MKLSHVLALVLVVLKLERVVHGGMFDGLVCKPGYTLYCTDLTIDQLDLVSTGKFVCPACPVPEPVVCPVPELVVCPVPEPVVCPVPEPVVCPVPEPAVCPVPEPAVCPVPEPTTLLFKAVATIASFAMIIASLVLRLCRKQNAEGLHAETPPVVVTSVSSSIMSIILELVQIATVTKGSTKAKVAEFLNDTYGDISEEAIHCIYEHVATKKKREATIEDPSDLLSILS